METKKEALKGFINYTQKQKKEMKQGEGGITLIALIIMVILLIILAMVSIKAVTGKEGILASSSNIANEYVIQQYGEQIEQLVHSIILKDSLIGKKTTVTSMAEEMEKEDWIKSAVPNEEAKDIIVTTTDGYIYQVYYDEETGKKEIEYIGKEDGEGIPEITASYDKVKAEIAAEAKCKGGIKEIQLIYKGEIVQAQPGETANFNVQKTGWYQIKAVANNGKTRSTWVRVSSTVIAPLIEVISDGEQENEWYGKDDKPVQIRISTDNPTVTRVYYKTNKDEEYTCVEGKVATLTIQDPGRTIIYAYVTDKQGNESEQTNKEIKYDNIHPEVGEIEIEGTKGIIDGTETGWYVSEEVTIKLNNMTDEPLDSGIVGFYYWEIPEGSSPSEIPEEQKTYVKGTTGQIKITKEGKVAIGIQAKDKAGNKTEGTKTIIVQKDSKAPIDFLPSIVEGSITAHEFTVTAGTTDEISEISHYNFYVKQGSTIVKELKNNIEGRFNVTELEGETTYNIVVEAVDKAGNIKTGTGITATTLVANTPPTKAVVSFNTKGTNYIKVNAKSTDVDGDKLTYTLYYGTSADSLIASTPLTNQTQNEQVSITTPTNLNQYTYYYWRVDVSDGKATTEGDIQTKIRTYCQASSCGGGSRTRHDNCPKTITSGGTEYCTGMWVVQSTTTIARTKCAFDDCKNYTTTRTIWKCNKCGRTTGGAWCKDEDMGGRSCSGLVSSTKTCPTCNGLGYYYTYSNCTHGYSYGSSHYYCNKSGHGNYKGSSSLHG